MIRSIVGSSIVLLCWQNILAAQPDNVKLTVLNLERTPITEVTVGQPFLVVTEYITMGSTIASPHIEGMDQLHIISSRISHSPIGSKVHVRAEYTVRIDTTQTHLLGPIRIGHHEYPTQCTIQSIEPERSSITGTQTEPFALLTISDAEPVIGQPIECTTTLFVPKHLSIELVGAQVDTSDHMGMVSIETPVEEYRGLRLFEGKEYQHVSWQYTIVPQKTGKITIPASSIDYSPPQQHPMSFFSSFWGTRTAKRIFSNSVTMTISALPEHEGPIHVIASRPQVNAHIDSTQVCVGDALEYTITVQSEHPIALYQPHQLVGLPATIKKYTSAPTITQENTTHQITLSSVLQCLEQKQITIPEQLLRIYDSHQKETTEWLLPAHTITVMPGNAPVSPPAIPQEAAPQADPAEQLKQLQEEQKQAFKAALMQQLVPLYAPPGRSYTLAELLLWFIICCMVLYAITPQRWLNQLNDKIHPYYAYYRTYVLIYTAQLMRRPDLLWPIMQHFFLMQGIIPTNDSTQLTYALPDKLKLTGVQRERFMSLWATIAQARMHGDKNSHAQLFQTLLAWLKEYWEENANA